VAVDRLRPVDLNKSGLTIRAAPARRRGPGEAAADREVIAARTERRRRERKARKITIPWSAVPPARILAKRWPASTRSFPR
jgi:hypothetical protein